MPIIYQKRIHREDLLKNRDVLYAFGDNDARKGRGGQAAAMRGEPNAVGIRTKKYPGYADGDYYTDTEYAENCLKIKEDIAPLIDQLIRGGVVVLPLDGIGTGLSNLNSYAPRTLRFLEEKLRALEQLPTGWWITGA